MRRRFVIRAFFDTQDESLDPALQASSERSEMSKGQNKSIHGFYETPATTATAVKLVSRNSTAGRRRSLSDIFTRRALDSARGERCADISRKIKFQTRVRASGISSGLLPEPAVSGKEEL